jgi:hypothetical protein
MLAIYSSTASGYISTSDVYICLQLMVDMITTHGWLSKVYVAYEHCMH